MDRQVRLGATLRHEFVAGGLVLFSRRIQNKLPGYISCLGRARAFPVLGTAVSPLVINPNRGHTHTHHKSLFVDTTVL